MIKVVKFGGTSLADAEQFKKAAKIIKAEESRKYIVPSAPGKRFKEDIKITDMLYQCYEAAAKGGDIEEIFEQITNRYREIIKGLDLNLSLENEFRQIKDAFINKAGRDFAASRGEYLNGLIMAEYIGYDFIDAADVIFFGENGVFDSEKTNEVLKSVLSKHEHAVIPGFYGSMPNDTIKTFSRGGSDISGSIVARAVMADVYENWTDVSGCMMADPRIVNDYKTIDIITYRELRELSYMGFSVLHEDAVFPVKVAGIPINIRNTNAPDDAGTMIVSECKEYNKTLVTGIAGKKGFSVIIIEKDMMNAEIGFGRRVLEVLEKQEISFEHLPSGIDTMSIVLSSAALNGNRDYIKEAICRAVEPDNIHIEDGLALIAVVGRGMKNTKGTAARVFKAIAESGVNVRMIDQGSSELNIIIGVDEVDFESALCGIYKEFVN
ncbi:MAG: aspartate kinase [Oscillospiraceae bacterium]|nr:aspartate kinase [Oscillospiraceae bacterium]